MSAPAPPIVIDGLDTSRWGEADTYAGWRAGGVTAVNATIAWWSDGLDDVVRHVACWDAWFERFAALIRPARCADDVRAAAREGRTGVVFGLQNGLPIGDDPGRVRTLHELGVRIVQLTYNDANSLGSGCYVAHDQGLSEVGRAAVGEMNAKGILVDVSHCGDRTSLDAVEASATPIAVTHANARSHIDHPRNKTDELIRAVARRGGVIGANAFPGFFPSGYDTTVEEYVDAIERLVELAGVDHVGVGTDFCHGHPRDWFRAVLATGGDPAAAERALERVPDPHRQLVGFESARAFPVLAERLSARGISDGDIRKLLGENWLRLFDEVWTTPETTITKGPA